MKRWLIIFAITIISLSVAACSDIRAKETVPTEESTEAESTVNEYDMSEFLGLYSNGRAGVTIESNGNNEMKVSVHWSSSAWESSDWTMSGTFNPDNAVFEYSDCVMTSHVYNREDDSLESETEDYTDGTGRFIFNKDNNELSFIWEDDMKNAGEGQTFTKYADLDKDASEFNVGQDYYVLSPDGLNVRSEPGTENDNIVGTLEKGSKVTCLEMKDNWMRINKGWICVNDGDDTLVGNKKLLQVEDILGQWGRPRGGQAAYGIVYFRKDNTLTFYDLNPEDYDGELIPICEGQWQMESDSVVATVEGEEWTFSFSEDNLFLNAYRDSKPLYAYKRSTKGIVPKP